jgi:hypothetical protein
MTQQVKDVLVGAVKSVIVGLVLFSTFLAGEYVGTSRADVGNLNDAAWERRQKDYCEEAYGQLMADYEMETSSIGMSAEELEAKYVAAARLAAKVIRNGSYPSENLVSNALPAGLTHEQVNDTFDSIRWIMDDINLRYNEAECIRVFKTTGVLTAQEAVEFCVSE